MRKDNRKDEKDNMVTGTGILSGAVTQCIKQWKF